MAWVWSDFSGFLLQLGADKTLINRGPFIPEMPARLITFTFAGGAGLTTEGMLDDQNFQMRVRGDANEQDWPEDTARQYDAMLLAAPMPMTIGTTRIRLIDRVGSAPTTLAPPDDGDRLEYVSNYRLVVGV